MASTKDCEVSLAEAIERVAQHLIETNFWIDMTDRGDDVYAINENLLQQLREKKHQNNPRMLIHVTAIVYSFNLEKEKIKARIEEYGAKTNNILVTTQAESSK